jgi:hypothetical protein
LVYHFIKESSPRTTSEVWKSTKLSRQHTFVALRLLESNGFLRSDGGSGATPKKWYVTDKHFDVTNCKWEEQLKIKMMEVTIKPDLAAMWLVESKPHWETKLIPIRRSIGLGAKPNTL